MAASTSSSTPAPPTGAWIAKRSGMAVRVPRGRARAATADMSTPPTGAPDTPHCRDRIATDHRRRTIPTPTTAPLPVPLR
ncbi:hypothetical protein [Streptomyces sp. NPDC001903]|uniref:hypothetical protein n=1 Tax=Streptomyces sp. NPDC001903 TaxID=3364622 RepID=UPI0036852859